MGILMYVGRYGTRFKLMCSLTVQKAWKQTGAPIMRLAYTSARPASPAFLVYSAIASLAKSSISAPNRAKRRYIQLLHIRAGHRVRVLPSMWPSIVAENEVCMPTGVRPI